MMIPRSVVARIRRLEERAARLDAARKSVRARGPVYSRAQLRIVEASIAHLLERYPKYPSNGGWGLDDLPSIQEDMFWRAAITEFQDWLSQEYPGRHLSKQEIVGYAPLIQDLAEMIFEQLIDDALPTAKRRYFFHPEVWAYDASGHGDVDEASGRLHFLLLVRNPSGRLLQQARALARALSVLPKRERSMKVRGSVGDLTPLDVARQLISFH